MRIRGDRRHMVLTVVLLALATSATARATEPGGLVHAVWSGNSTDDSSGPGQLPEEAGRCVVLGRRAARVEPGISLVTTCTFGEFG